MGERYPYVDVRSGNLILAHPYLRVYVILPRIQIFIPIGTKLHMHVLTTKVSRWFQALYARFQKEIMVPERSILFQYC